MSAQAIVETDLEIVQPQPLRLHENGDVTLILESSDGKTQTNIIASTDILSAASGYCAKLLHSLRRKKVDSESRQKEDSESRRKEDPESGKPLTLQDEDAEATKIVLSILHYKFNENCKNLSPLMLARVSKQCWMYECTGAVQVHFDLWMQSMPPNDPRTNPLLFIENLGYLIFSALLFQREDAVRSITRDAVYHLSLGFQTAWTKNQIISLLPDEICRGISVEIHNRLFQLQVEIQKTVTDLMQETSAFATLRNSISNFSPCNAPTRVLNYIEVLRRNNLWPTAAVFAPQSNPTIDNILTRVNAVVAAVQQGHACSGGSNCHLTQKICDLHQTCKGIACSFGGLDTKRYSSALAAIESGRKKKTGDSIVVAAPETARKRRMVAQRTDEME